MKPEMFRIAVRCMESAEGLDGPRRRARERQAARYFWIGCGVLKPATRNPQMHAGGGDPDAGRTRPGGGRVRPFTRAPGEESAS